jgi:hypothetical protein
MVDKAGSGPLSSAAQRERLPTAAMIEAGVSILVDRLYAEDVPSLRGAVREIILLSHQQAQRDD